MRAAEGILLERQVHGESGRTCVCRRDCVSTKGKDRKHGGRGVETPGPSAEPEQVKEEGVDQEIVREFLLESQAESEPAGKQPGGRGSGDRGEQLCASAGGEPGDAECDGAGAGIADAAGFPEVNQKHNLRWIE